MKAHTQLTWDNFRTTIIAPDQKRLHRVSIIPSIEIYSDGAAGRLGLLLEAEPVKSLPPILTRLTFINSRYLEKDGRSFFEISVDRLPLHRQFYHFAVAVAERVLAGEEKALDAIARELQCFADLFEEQSRLSIERQVGLVGELQFLERLMAVHGAGAVDAWLGPFGEPHDFRLEQNEFEVKATVMAQRVHTIHGAEQLVPSHGCSLFLVSVLLGPPGKSVGFSLPELVAAIELRLGQEPPRSARFRHALASVGYSAEDAALYSKRFALRRALAMVPVDHSCPAITRAQMQKAVGDTFARIGTIQYEVNLEGLEKEEGTEYFAAAMLP